MGCILVPRPPHTILVKDPRPRQRDRVDDNMNGGERVRLKLRNLTGGWYDYNTWCWSCCTSWCTTTSTSAPQQGGAAAVRVDPRSLTPGFHSC